MWLAFRCIFNRRNAGSAENIRNALPFIESVNIGLKRFKHNVNFVKCGATLWSRLSMYPSGSKQMINQKCITTILLTLAEHSDAAFVIEKFVRTLTNMVAG